MKMTILGNGDSLGTPRVYCDCPVCGEARTGGVNARLRPSLWLEPEGEEPVLLDCGPDWRTQMERLGVRQVRRCLLTHAHFDHIGGLVEWADALRWREERGELYAPRDVLEEVMARFPWLGGRLNGIAVDEGWSCGGWSVRPWRVNHGKNGYSYAYRFDRPDGRSESWVYCPDSFELSDEEKAPLRGIGLLILGTSFYEEPFPRETRSLYDVREGLALAQEIGARLAVFTHQSHDIDLTRDYGLPAGAEFAREGMVLRPAAVSPGCE